MSLSNCLHSQWRCVIAMAVILLGVAPLPAGADCTLTASSIIFGNYNMLSATPLDSAGSLVFRCTNKDHNVQISIDKGGAASFSQRRLLRGTQPLFYNLYLDAARTIIWGDGTAGTQAYFIRNPQPNNANITIPVFGRIPAGQQVGSGTYSDALTMTINF